MAKWTAYGTFQGRPAWCTVENGKVTSDPPEVARQVMEWVKIVEKSDFPLPAGGLTRFRLTRRTAHVPLAYLTLIKRVMKVERLEGDVPNERFPHGMPQPKDRRPDPDSMMSKILF